MADLKISALPAGNAAQSTDKIPAARSGANVSLDPPSIAASHRGIAKAATYTAVSGDDILADTSGGSFTINVPTGGTAGMKFRVTDATDSFGTNPLTIGRNSQTIMGLAEDMVVSSDGASFELYHNGTTWKLR